MQHVKRRFAFNGDTAGKIQRLERSLPEVERAENSIEGSGCAAFPLLLCELFLCRPFQLGEQDTIALGCPFVQRRAANLGELFPKAVLLIACHLTSPLPGASIRRLRK